MSFHEKSAWIMLSVLSLAYGWYGLKAFKMYQSGITDIAPYVPLMAVAVVVLVVVAVASYIAVAIFSKDRDHPDFDKSDERDKLFAMKGEYNSGWILGVAALCALGMSMTEASHFEIAHVILGGLVISEIVRFSLIIRYYRRGY